MSNGERWTLRLGEGLFPWWVFDKASRVPQTGVIDYLPLARLLWTSADKPVGEVMHCAGPIYERLIAPLLLAALNIDPRIGSAKLAAALVRETLARGGRSYGRFAPDGVGKAFVDPAIGHLRKRGVSIALQDELLSLHFAGGSRAARLDFYQARSGSCRRRRGGPRGSSLCGGGADNWSAGPVLVSWNRQCPFSHCRAGELSADDRRHSTECATGYFLSPAGWR